MSRRVWLNLIVVCGMLIAMGAAGAGTASAQGPWTLTITVDPAGGGTTVPEAGIAHSYPHGTIVEPVTATANTGWRFTGWEGLHALECALGSVTMTGNRECTATFSGEHWLGASSAPPEGGTVTKTPGLAEYPDGYPPGTVVTLTVTPNPDWKFDGWSGRDGAECEDLVVEMGDHDVFCIATFSSLSPPPPEAESWMGDIDYAIQDRRLKDVVVPGTHDAGTYALNKNSEWVSFADEPEMWQWIQNLDYAIVQAPRVIGANWARTQSPEQNIYQQLKGGSRYFDLRFVYVKGDDLAYIYHGTMRGTNTRDHVLDDVKRFLDEPGHEKEIIVLELSKWAKMTPYSHKQFVQAILDRFKYDMVPEEAREWPLKDIWASGTRLLIKYDDLNPDWFRGPPEPFDPPEYHLFWTDDETILFTTSSAYQPDLDDEVMPPALRQEFAENGFPVTSAYQVEVKIAGMAWKITFDAPCRQGFDVRKGTSGDLLVTQPDKILCRPWGATYDRGTMKTRFLGYLEHGCCNSDCGVPNADQNCCQCPSLCSGSTNDRLFVNQGLLTPDEDGKLVKCGVAREILDALEDLAWYCDIPYVGPKLCEPYRAIPNAICGTDTSTTPRSLWELVSKDAGQPNMFSTRVAEWMRDSWSNCTHNARENLNIVQVDYYDYSTLVDESIKINRGDYNDATEMGTFWVPPDHPQVVEGSPVQIWAHFNDDDPCDNHTGTIDWGDGTVEAVVVDQATNQITASHTYADNGAYNATLCVGDGPQPQGDYVYHYSEDCGSLTIEVSNVVPTVIAGANQIIYEGDEIKLDPATFSDPGFDCPNCVPPTEEYFNASIDWGDGTTEPAPDITLTETPGSEGVETTGTVSASHQYLAGPGVYTVTVCVKDDDMPDYAPEACDSLNVTVVHGFLRFCAYADDDESKIGEETLADCPLVPSGVPGEQRASGVGSRGKVDVKEKVTIQGILSSLTDRIDIDKESSIFGALTAGYDVKVEQQSQIHDSITSGHKVEVKKDAWVGGDITAADEVKVESGATVTGDIYEFASVPPIPDITWVQFSVEPGSQKVTVRKNASRTLDPGAYKDVKVKEGATLTLLSGQYVFRKFQMEKDAVLQLNLQNGPIVVDVAKKLEFKDGAQMQVVSDPADAGDVLFRVARGHVELKKEGAYLGTFLARTGDVKLGEDATLTGALYGRKVEIKKETHIVGMPARDLFASLFVTP
jgi:hypothetical protein